MQQSVPEQEGPGQYVGLLAGSQVSSGPFLGLYFSNCRNSFCRIFLPSSEGTLFSEKPLIVSLLGFQRVKETADLPPYVEHLVPT